MKNVDLMLTNSAQIVSCVEANAALRGEAMGRVSSIKDGAVVIHDGKIVAVGDSAEIAQQYTATQTIDCTNRAILPGFVDSHTHVVHGGNRVHEFEMRIQGASYMEIMAAGGGIVSTMQHTRRRVSRRAGRVRQKTPRHHARPRHHNR